MEFIGSCSVGTEGTCVSNDYIVNEVVRTMQHFGGIIHFFNTESIINDDVKTSLEYHGYAYCIMFGNTYEVTKTSMELKISAYVGTPVE
jgi:hypothetical protein